MMEPAVVDPKTQIVLQLIQTVGTVLIALATPIGAYFIAKMYATMGAVREQMGVVQKQMDGQLSETVALKQAVSFAAGEDKQRDKQELKDAVKAGIKEANGETLH